MSTAFSRIILPLIAIPLAAAASGHPAFALFRGVPLRAAGAAASAGLQAARPFSYRYLTAATLRMSVFPNLFGMRGGGSSDASGSTLAIFPSAFHDAAPSWESLDKMVKETPDGKRLRAEQEDREVFMYKYAHTYTYIYIHTHTHTYTQSTSNPDCRRALQ